MISDKVPICSFCEFTKATEQTTEQNRFSIKLGAVLKDTSVGRLAAALCRHHDQGQYSQPIGQGGFEQ